MNCFSPSDDMSTTVVQICQMTFFAVYSAILYIAILAGVGCIVVLVKYPWELRALVVRCWRRVPSFYDR